MPRLIPHLKNSFFPTGELGSGGITGETVVAGSQETGLEETGTKYESISQILFDVRNVEVTSITFQLPSCHRKRYNFS